MRDLEHALGPGEVREAVLAEVDEVGPGGQASRMSSAVTSETTTCPPWAVTRAGRSG